MFENDVHPRKQESNRQNDDSSQELGVYLYFQKTNFGSATKILNPMFWKYISRYLSFQFGIFWVPNWFAPIHHGVLSQLSELHWCVVAESFRVMYSVPRYPWGGGEWENGRWEAIKSNEHWQTIRLLPRNVGLSIPWATLRKNIGSKKETGGFFGADSAPQKWETSWRLSGCRVQKTTGFWTGIYDHRNLFNMYDVNLVNMLFFIQS